MRTTVAAYFTRAGKLTGYSSTPSPEWCFDIVIDYCNCVFTEILENRAQLGTRIIEVETRQCCICFIKRGDWVTTGSNSSIHFNRLHFRTDPFRPIAEPICTHHPLEFCLYEPRSFLNREPLRFYNLGIFNVWCFRFMQSLNNPSIGLPRFFLTWRWTV